MDLIESNRCILRQPRTSDLISFHYYASKAKIGPMAGWFPHKNLDETKMVLDGFIREKNIWAITIKPHDVMIGTIGIHETDRTKKINNSIEIGYVLDDNYWNQGYMTEVVKEILKYLFKIKNYDYVLVTHFTKNKASKKVIEKCGFKYVETIKTVLLENIEIKEIMCYQISIKEYLENEKNT